MIIFDVKAIRNPEDDWTMRDINSEYYLEKRFEKLGLTDKLKSMMQYIDTETEITFGSYEASRAEGTGFGYEMLGLTVGCMEYESGLAVGSCACLFIYALKLNKTMPLTYRCFDIMNPDFKDLADFIKNTRKMLSNHGEIKGYSPHSDAAFKTPDGRQV